MSALRLDSAMMMGIRAVCAALALADAAVITPASAQTAYPLQTVRIVVGTAPGGVLDIYSRLLTPTLQEKLGPPVMATHQLSNRKN